MPVYDEESQEMERTGSECPYDVKNIMFCISIQVLIACGILGYMACFDII